MIGLSLLGAGRMGQLHARNILAHPNAQLVSVFDPHLPSARSLAAFAGGKATGDVEEAIHVEGAQGVVICSPTKTHVDYVLEAVRAGRFVLCEKPIDLDIARAHACIEELGERSSRVMMAFNRRFDPSQAHLRRLVRDGAIGTVEQMIIICRDPVPPPPDYLRTCGGIFRDMMIHDFDQARAISGINFVSVFAQGDALFDEETARAGDRDTATAQLIGPRGENCTIFNSRRCLYGFEQRIEVFGSKGTLRMDNPRALLTSHFSAEGEQLSRLCPFFPERYETAYQEELNHFVSGVEKNSPFEVTIHDGLAALMMANAAQESADKRQPVPLDPRTWAPLRLDDNVSPRPS